ncbi:MAG: hypothetical protein ACP5IZ_10215 [Thermoprotei archaeon]
MKRKTQIILLILPSLINFTIYLAIFGPDPFPPINDPAIWLKNANALLGNTYPLWNQTTLQYPPLFNMILATFIILTHNALLSLKILGITLISLLPLTVYPLTKEITKNYKAGIVAVWLTAFHPAFSEMYGWGGYPNLLGIIFLNLSLYFLYKIMKGEKNSKNILMASIFTSLLTITHHLTIIVYAAIGLTILLVTFLNIIKKHTQLSQFQILIPITISAITFITWRILAGPFQYIVFNYASQLNRPFDMDAFWWIFKDPLAVSLLLLTATMGSLELYYLNKKEELIILLVWTLFPFLFTQSYIIGIALDPKRFPMFSIPAITILSSTNTTLLKENINPKTLTQNLDPQIIVTSLLILTIIINIITGITTTYKVNEYYHYITDYAYASDQRLQALNWIKTNTPQNTTFVADETLGRWIEGYAQRRTLILLPPFQIFIIGELERYEAANLILTTYNIELRNEYLRILDGTPYDTTRTPWIEQSTGPDYTKVIYLIDSTVQTSFIYAKNTWIESPYKATVSNITWTNKTPTYASISITYNSKSLNIIKTIGLAKNSRTVDIYYTITPTINATLQKTEIPIWIPYESTLNNYIYYSNKLRLIIDGKIIEIKTNANNYTIGPDPKWGQLRILYTYIPKNNTIKAELHITLMNAEKSWWNNHLWAYTSDEIIKKYNIEYIALSKPVEDYTKFLTNNKYTPVFENNLIIIFKIKNQTTTIP